VGAHANGPSGTVTFVLTDIEGSTKHAKALGDDYAVLIGRHHELLRAVWHAHDGYEVATEGDAFIVAFADADAGVLAAVDAQRRIMEQSWPGEREVRIRIGLHAGYARPVDGDYRALSLNQASRIVGCANGGQTFATVDVLSLVTERIGDVHLVPLGKYRVRDFDDPVQLHSVVAAGMPRIDAAPRVRPAEGHNIVPPTATLVGRDADVTALVAGLGSRSLTTITGPGGVGKTRLAVEVAIRAVPDWRTASGSSTSHRSWPRRTSHPPSHRQSARRSRPVTTSGPTSSRTSSAARPSWCSTTASTSSTGSRASPTT
jgi:class 3 adenylate cyclase